MRILLLLSFILLNNAFSYSCYSNSSNSTLEVIESISQINITLNNPEKMSTHFYVGEIKYSRLGGLLKLFNSKGNKISGIYSELSQDLPDACHARYCPSRTNSYRTISIAYNEFDHEYFKCHL